MQQRRATAANNAPAASVPGGLAPPEAITGAGSASALRVAFLHPNLGIGGAERLVVDCASALQQSGARVHLFTNYHDPSHCYEETRDGTLKVTVYGQTSDNILGRFRVLIAIVRMIYLTIIFALFHAKEYDVVVVDQVSHSLPILVWFTSCKVLFYCHFPDQLLTSRTSLLKRLYRFPFDWSEEWTTGLAHLILVNSEFTLDTFRRTFTRLRSLVDAGRVHVLYPSIDFARYHAISSAQVAKLPPANRGEVALLDQLIYGEAGGATPKVHLFTSINRFERKKNILLAIEAFARYQSELQQAGGSASAAAPAAKGKSKRNVSSASARPVRLLVSGGYDPVNIENREHYTELWSACERLALTPVELKNVTRVGKDGTSSVVLECTGVAPSVDDTRPVVYFLRSFTDLQRAYLLTNSTCVLYTPSMEHFGIVPVEAMYMRRPVLACRSGGPKESVVDHNDEHTRHEATGFLCEPDAREWSEAIATMVVAENEATPGAQHSLCAVLGERGHARVLERFHFDTFQQKLLQHVQTLAAAK